MVKTRTPSIFAFTGLWSFSSSRQLVLDGLVRGCVHAPPAAKGYSSTLRPASSSSILPLPSSVHSLPASREQCWCIQAEPGSLATCSFTNSVMMECTEQLQLHGASLPSRQICRWHIRPVGGCLECLPGHFEPDQILMSAMLSVDQFCACLLACWEH